MGTDIEANTKDELNSEQHVEENVWTKKNAGGQKARMATKVHAKKAWQVMRHCDAKGPKTSAPKTMTSWEEQALEGKWEWAGHAMRMKPTRIAYRTTTYRDNLWWRQSTLMMHHADVTRRLTKKRWF